ncbi:MAG: efflux RND transporter periplasmic adaptor subunit [Pseudomonadota bacterium]
MTRSFFIAVFLALAVVAWVASGQFGHSDNLPQARKPAADLSATEHQPSVRVRTQAAEPRISHELLRGRTEAVRMVKIKSDSRGRISTLNADRGASVSLDEILVQLDPEDRPARLSEAEALEAQRLLEYEAAQKLSEKGFRAETQLAAAKAAYEEAKAKVSAAQVELDNTNIRAPFGGLIDNRMVEIGDFVDIGDPIAEVVDLDPILVVAQVNEAGVEYLTLGQKGEVRLVTGQRLEGRLRFISSVADSATRTFRIELEVANPNRKIPDGVSADIRLPLQETVAHRVSPAILTLSDKGEVGVMTLSDKDIATFTPVKILDTEADGVWITGLPETVVFITVGHEFVADGQKVLPVDEVTLKPFIRGPTS